MHLERDQFVVTYDASRATVDDLVATIKQAGYKTTVVDPDDANGTAIASNELEEAELPAFFTKALARARQEGKPLVLDFQAEWCVPCKRMEQETFADARVADLLEQCILLKIDTDEHPDLAKHFGVVGLPDLRLLASDGKQQRQLQGFQDVASMLPELKKLLADESPREP